MPTHEGFYGNWFVDVSGNYLTQFSASVFLPMLQQMEALNYYPGPAGINALDSKTTKTFSYFFLTKYCYLTNMIII